MGIIAGPDPLDLPTWAPSVDQVANYIPHRTIIPAAGAILESQDTYELTFDTHTQPNDTSVAQLIVDGVAWVGARIFPLNEASQPAAGVCVALYAAAAVERTFTSDPESMPRANDLEKRLDKLLEDLIEANDYANGNAGIEIVPAFSYSCADPRWDYPRYW